MKVRTHIPISLFVSLMIPIGVTTALADDSEKASSPYTVRDVNPLEHRQLNDAANAYLGLMQIQPNNHARTLGISDPDRIEEMKEHTNEITEGIIERAGLTVSEYDEIMEAIEEDPVLKQRFLALVNKNHQKEREKPFLMDR